MAGVRFLASLPRTLQGCGIARSTLVASAGGWVGGSDGGFKGAQFGTPVGCRSDTGPVPHSDGARVESGRGDPGLGRGEQCGARGCLG